MTEDRTLGTTRIVAFSPKQVFEAFASAELLAEWWGPEGFSSTFETFEFKEGGRWVFVMHGPDGNNYENYSYFEAIVPDTKVTIRHDCLPFFTLTVELTPSEQGTHLSWSQVFDDAQTARELERRVGSANEQNIDRLERVLSKRDA